MNARIETEVTFVGGAQSENKSYEGARVIVNIEWGCELGTAAVEVEEPISGSEALEEDECEGPPVVLRTFAVLQRPPVSNSPTSGKITSEIYIDDGRRIDIVSPPERSKLKLYRLTYRIRAGRGRRTAAVSET